MILPYGDQRDDGAVQLSFTLPMPYSRHSLQCAEALVLGWGFQHVSVVHTRPVGDEFSFFIVLARTDKAIDLERVVAPAEAEHYASFEDINHRLLERFGRPLNLVAAATGSDAHTVGLSSILSIKGRSGDHGLEKYRAFRIVNLGSQVKAEELVDTASAERADVVLVSQVVTQRGIDRRHFVDVRLAFEAAEMRDSIVLLGGGPGVTMRDASILGYDGMFGRGTRPSDVAAFLSERLLNDATP